MHLQATRIKPAMPMNKNVDDDDNGNDYDDKLANVLLNILKVAKSMNYCIKQQGYSDKASFK